MKTTPVYMAMIIDKTRGVIVPPTRTVMVDRQLKRVKKFDYKRELDNY